MPLWVKHSIDAWTEAAGIVAGRAPAPIVARGHRIIGDELQAAHAVGALCADAGRKIGIDNFGAHDLRRTCAKLCRSDGAKLEQIQMMLGHSSVQTTERYLGSQQDIAIGPNDSLVFLAEFTATGCPQDEPEGNRTYWGITFSPPKISLFYHFPLGILLLYFGNKVYWTSAVVFSWWDQRTTTQKEQQMNTLTISMGQNKSTNIEGQDDLLRSAQCAGTRQKGGRNFG